MVSKEDLDKSKTSVAEMHLPLQNLVNKHGGLPSEDEIALAYVNKQQLKDSESRKLKNAATNSTKKDDKENAQPRS
jgi:hypothetical protein